MVTATPGGQGNHDHQARQVAAQEEIDDATQQGTVGCVRRGMDTGPPARLRRGA